MDKRMCSDNCRHCIYIGEGDFICETTHKICIENWIPKPCKFLGKKKIRGDKNANLKRNIKGNAKA